MGCQKRWTWRGDLSFLCSCNLHRNIVPSSACVCNSNNQITFFLFLQQTIQLGDGWSRTTFEKSVPMSTYLVCFAVHQFQSVERISASGKPVSPVAAWTWFRWQMYCDLHFLKNEISLFKTQSGTYFSLSYSLFCQLRCSQGSLWPWTHTVFCSPSLSPILVRSQSVPPTQAHGWGRSTVSSTSSLTWSPESEGIYKSRDKRDSQAMDTNALQFSVA